MTNLLLFYSFLYSTFVYLVGRLQTTTVKTSWKEAPTEPAIDASHSSTNSHTVVNGHAHAQVKHRNFFQRTQLVSHQTHLKNKFKLYFSLFLDFFGKLAYAQASSLLDESQSIDEDDNSERENTDAMLGSETRRSLHKYTI